MKRNAASTSLVLLAVALVFALVLSACGSKSDSGGASPASPSQSAALSASSEGSGAPAEKVKLKVATWAGATELKEFEDLVAKLNASATDYELEVQSIPSDYYQKLQTMIAGKQAPDFMWLSQEYIPQYASLGAIAELDDLLAGVGSFKEDDYFPGALDVGKFNGKLYALPFIAQPYVVYYNQDLFEKAGVPLPTNDWTWDQFIETGKKLTKDGQWGALLNNIPTAMYTWSYGGDVFDKDGNIKLDSPESIQGLEMYQKIVQSGIAPSRAQADSMGNGDMFKTGKVAMFIGGAGDDFEKTVKFKVGMAVPPKGTQQVTFSWIGATVMSKSTKNPEIAAKALVDLTNAIHQWKVVAPTKTGFDLIKTSRPEKEYAIDTIRKASEVARGFNNQPKESEIDSAIWEKLTQPIEKGDDVKKAVQDTIAKFKEITQ
jgi:multiple sugar transport system substrate-binding protein